VELVQQLGLPMQASPMTSVAGPDPAL
jgi:hypothetical protein